MSKSHFTTTAGAALAALLTLTSASLAADAVQPAPAPAEAAAQPAPAAATDAAAEAPAPAAPAAAEAAAPAAAPAVTPAAAPAPATQPQRAAAAPASEPQTQLKAAELSLGALVFGADGKDVGKIVRISSTATGAVSEIQLDTGTSGVVVVPANAIANGGAKVKLSLTSDQIGKLQQVGDDKNG